MLLLWLVAPLSPRFIRLVRWDTIMDSTDRPAEMMGMINSPTLCQEIASFQNRRLGTWERSSPRNMKLMVNRPVMPVAVCTAPRFSAVSMEDRVSSLNAPVVYPSQPSAPATEVIWESLRLIK